MKHTVGRRNPASVDMVNISLFIKGSLAEKLPIYEQHRRVIESLRNSGVNYKRCVTVESSTIAA